MNIWEFFYFCMALPYDQAGEEKVKIERPQATLAPVWSLAWNPNKLVHDVYSFCSLIQNIFFMNEEVCYFVFKRIFIEQWKTGHCGL